MRFVILTAALLSIPAAAQIPANTPQPVSQRDPAMMRQGPTIVAEPVALALAGFDGDQDGFVTRAEANAGAARSFTAVAKGASDFGYIGYSDWAARWLGDANALPNPYEVDSNRDNRITQVEIVAALTAAFDRFDKDKNGQLNRAELLTLRRMPFGGEDRPGRERRERPEQPRRQ